MMAGGKDWFSDWFGSYKPYENQWAYHFELGGSYRINKKLESGCGESHTDGCGQGESGHSYGGTIQETGFILPTKGRDVIFMIMDCPNPKKYQRARIEQEFQGTSAKGQRIVEEDSALNYLFLSSICLFRVFIFFTWSLIKTLKDLKENRRLSSECEDWSAHSSENYPFILSFLESESTFASRLGDQYKDGKTVIAKLADTELDCPSFFQKRKMTGLRDWPRKMNSSQRSPFLNLTFFIKELFWDFALIRKRSNRPRRKIFR